MNIYKTRLVNLNRMLVFLSKYYPASKLKSWQDVISNREGTPQKLWSLRVKLGLTANQFASAIGMKKADYERFERIGARVPGYVLRRISRKLKKLGAEINI